ACAVHSMSSLPRWRYGLLIRIEARAPFAQNERRAICIRESARGPLRDRHHAGKIPRERKLLHDADQTRHGRMLAAQALDGALHVRSSSSIQRGNQPPQLLLIDIVACPLAERLIDVFAAGCT